MTLDFDEDAGKPPFDIEIAMDRLREAVRPFPPAGLFALDAEGFDSLFEILVACILSIRTTDEVMLPAARALFARARTPEAIAALDEDAIIALISACTFPEPKARQIREIAQRAVTEFGGALPCDEATLLSFHGVGPKCAHLALGIACGQPYIGVDVHVHRIVNRWGWVRAKTPEKTMAALEEKLPRAYWVEINKLLVPFGKRICTGTLPRCSTCPLLSMCRQVDVMEHR